MTTEGFKRKLTTVLSADVVGYSRLMGEDEEATVKTLEAYKGVLFTLIKQHRGRVVDSPGDNLLAEFGSVVDAVQCAVAVQKEFQSRNADLPENRRMRFRIGINLGDVIEEEERIYGDGVNIAARLEALADPGGICISKTAFEHIESKLPFGYRFLGEKTVKNIAKPVGAYKVLMDPRVIDAEEEVEVNGRLPDKPPPPLPDKPSIAVLPFLNMSDDPQQEYFSDGLSEDIITALSQSSDMFVIARNSTFVYKGKSVNVQQVGRELGVRYVLEGSVRKVGDRVRITAQLIDATTGHHLWAERYDRDLEDIFAIQDGITLKILTALKVKLTEGEQARLYAKGTEDIEAYLKMGQARSYFYRFNRGSNIMARQICEEVIALDPKWDLPHTVLGWTYFVDVYWRWSDSPDESVRKAFQCAQRAISLNESPFARALLGYLYTLTRQHEKAIEESERSIALDPNSADAHAWYGFNLIYFGDHAKAISLFGKALRLNPFPPSWYFVYLGVACRFLGRYDEAISAGKKAIYKEPSNVFAHIGLAATYAMAGREKDARAEGEEVLKMDPNFSLEHFANMLPYKNQADKEYVVDALRKAGLK
ncbi:MAG: adenylate/guanylate cyclase domain-containing protein [Desulfobacteraceae bacterium]|jgi:adenylate cyclase